MRCASPGLRAILAAIALIGVTAVATPVSAQQPVNPTASSVKEEQLLDALKGAGAVSGRITIPDERAANLERPANRDWTAFHQGALPWIGAIAILGMLLALAVFFLVKGRIRTESGISGVKIQRFNAFERFTHWITATCFIILAISGLNLTFGKSLIMPLIGAEAFAVFSQWGKYAHNYLAWPFMLGLLLMIGVWVRDNIPDRVDWAWLKAGGGFFGKQHPAARRFNAGQKLIFWSVILGGVVLSASGIILMFPFTVTGIAGMQVTQIVHALAGVILIAIMIAHIYIGTLGMEGAYDAMGSGAVDLNWAREHHSLWVDEQQAKTAGGPQAVPRPVAAE